MFRMTHKDTDGERRLYHLCLGCAVAIFLDKRGVEHIIKHTICDKNCDICQGNLKLEAKK